MKNRRLQVAIEVLERRQLLSLAPAGVEFRANTFTTAVQSAASIAADGDGDFVVVWQSLSQDGSDYGVYGQRYNAVGVAQGAEFRVNSHTAGGQLNPAVAMDSDGDFVVVWQSYLQDGNNTFGIYARRYSAVGLPQGDEFRVNTYTLSNQFDPAIAMDAAGDFAVTWTSYTQDGSSYGIYGQRFDAAGLAQGAEFRVNSYTTGAQRDASVAIDSDGDFVIAWVSLGQDGSSNGIFARRYDSAGTAQGLEFQVNTYTTSHQVYPAVGIGSGGNVVIAWHSFGQDGSSNGVFAQRYSDTGVTLGLEFQANTITSNNQQYPAVGLTSTGGVVVAWESRTGDGSTYGVYARSYDAAGSAQGTEFRANSHTTLEQIRPALAVTPAGDVIVAWQSRLQDGDGYGIYAQRYDESTDLAGPVVGGVFVHGQRVFPYTSYLPPLSQVTVSFSENVTDAGGASAANSVTNPANWLITRNGIDLTPATTITYGFNFATNRYEAVLHLPGSYDSGNFLVMARGNIRDIAGNPLDGNLDGTPGGNHLVPFSIDLGPRGAEFQVNSYTTESQSVPAIAMDSTGNFVVAWQGHGPEGSGQFIYARRYDAAGVAQGSEFQLSTHTSGQGSPAVAMSPAGDFVVAWQAYLQDGSSYGVYARRYNAAGEVQGSEIQVNTYTTDSQTIPAVAMDAGGNFVVTWQSNAQDGNLSGVYAQRFNAAGVPQGAEFKANAYTTGHQRVASVAMSPAGEFVLTWESNGQDGDLSGIYAKRYDAAGVALGAEFKVNSFTTNNQRFPSIAMDQEGDFVITWTSTTQDGSDNGIYAQRYSAAGAALGAEFRVNTHTTGRQQSPSIAMDSAGNFAVVWISDLQDGSDYGIYAQRYTAAGATQGSELSVNTHTAGRQNLPVIGADSIGNFVVAWTSNDQDGSEYGIYAQRYGTRSTPLVLNLQDSPDPVFAGNSVTLAASGVSSPNGSVTSVSFYRESNGEPGLQVGAFGDTLVGTTSTPSGGFWSVNASTTGLANITYTYWAQATDETGMTGAPVSTTSTVTTPGPQIIAAQFDYDTLPQKLRFTFDRDVSGNDPGDISLADIALQNIGGGAVPLLTMLPYGTDGTNVVTFTMNTQLADGNYRATISAAGVTDPISDIPMAGDYLFDFFILAGDADHNRIVDVRDLYILSQNWLGTGKTFSQADFNYDTLVNKVDLTTLAQKWQQNLAEPAPPLPAASASARRPTRTAARTPVRVIDLVT